MGRGLLASVGVEWEGKRKHDSAYLFPFDAAQKEVTLRHKVLQKPAPSRNADQANGADAWTWCCARSALSYLLPCGLKTNNVFHHHGLEILFLCRKKTNVVCMGNTRAVDVVHPPPDMLIPPFSVQAPQDVIRNSHEYRWRLWCPLRRTSLERDTFVADDSGQAGCVSIASSCSATPFSRSAVVGKECCISLASLFSLPLSLSSFLDIHLFNQIFSRSFSLTIFHLSSLFFFASNSSMTMTMTHSEKSVQQLLEAWPYRQERRLMWLAMLARFARTHC